ncbi:MAG TPA: hypothetical protein VNT58_03365 [Gaiellaceae bacterium]|nr:hypothetical protein [Gaiellaceae bacterium]
MSDRFEDLVDDPRLGAEERERLRRMHDLLLAVGPPPEAPAHLEPPVEADVVALRPRRRPLLLLAATVALAAAAGGGYLAGRDAPNEAAAPPATTVAPPATTAPTTTTPPPARVPLVAMRGVGAAAAASATVEILPRADSGDYPVRLRVKGLPANETFEMWVVDDDGELDTLCGTFRTTGAITDAVITAPYEMRTRDEWVVVRPGTTEPLLRT